MAHDTLYAIGEALIDMIPSKTGCSFAAARQQAVTELGCQGSLLRQPNNTLGVEYLKALLRLESPINPCGLPRDLSLKSASQLRADLDNPSWRKHVPSAALRQCAEIPLRLGRTGRAGASAQPL